MKFILAKKISLLSKGLKYVCLLGIILLPLPIFFYWMLDFSKVKFLANNNWHIQLSDMPYISSGHLSLNMKLIGFGLDLIPCAFFIAILIFLAKLFHQYQYLYFFSKTNIRYLRWIASLLFLQVLISPLYLALRSHIFTPGGQEYSVNLFGPNDFKALAIAFGISLFAYITEAGLRFEEELVGTI